MTRILCATDFSESSIKAAQYAYQLARKNNAELILFHVYDIPTLPEYDEQPTFENIEEKIVHEKKRKLQNLYHIFISKVEQDVVFEVKENTSPVKAILSIIKEKEADLVVMGQKGESDLKDIIVGNTTKEIIERAPCPVLVIPKDADYKPITRMAYASDLEKEDIPALKRLIQLTDVFHPEIIVIHAFPNKNEKAENRWKQHQNNLKEKVNYEKLQFERMFTEEIAEEINHFVETHDIDILAMLEREKDQPLINRLFHIDLVKQIGFNYSVPVISFNRKYVTAPEKEVLLETH